jgi:hypothetical protein
MGLVIQQLEVLELEIQDGRAGLPDAKARQRPWLPGQLESRLINVVAIQVHIAQGMHEIAGLKIARVCHHHGQQGIRANVERHAQEQIGTPLIELATQSPIGYVELE